MRVLIIEDNEILGRNLVRFLSLKNITADLSCDGKDGLYKASTKYYDVIVLDLLLPGIWWLEICQRLREKEVKSSIIMLTSLWSNDDIITGLESWADDYLVKPFEYDVLIARMFAVSRRRNINTSNTILSHKNIVLDLNKHSITKDNKDVSLSKLEFNLLKYLLQNKWKALSRQDIYEKVWWEYDGDFLFSKTIDVYIWYLRKKLWKDIIETKKWFWFIINEEKWKN